MAVEQKKILIRRGNKADLVVTDLQPGEQVLALDTNEVGVKTSGGDVLWYATKDLGPNAAVPITRKVAGEPLSNDITAPQLALHLYPVGSIYMSTSNVNPSTYFGGTWEAWGAGRVPVGVSSTDVDFTAGKTGGEKTHELTVNEMPSHTHPVKDGTYGTQICRGDGGGGSISAYTITSLPLQNNSTSVFSALATGGNAAHNNLQPYITCYMWHRTV